MVIQRDTITKRKEELNEEWQTLKQLAIVRQEKLFGAHEIQRFNRGAETFAWIAEKDVVLSSDDYGRDLASVQTLQGKHKAVERDLAAGAEAQRLCPIHPNHSAQIRDKQSEIADYWQSLTAKGRERKQKLDESYYLHRFLADFRDLVSWINGMKAIISADELAKDAAGAEALLECHEEHKGEIDAREDSFKLTTESEQKLLDWNIFATILIDEQHYAAQRRLMLLNRRLALQEKSSRRIGIC